ncbi:retinol dehydrogenase 16-like isoform X2 [Varroa destructor]|nr:retinol dehydrogenase 16-like isoform X2 [Varroa destructor]
MKNLSSAKKAVLVTGCDSGFGLVLCKRLVATGFSVFAACSDLDGEGAKELRGHHSKKIRVIEMDVTSEESVKTAAFHVKRFLDQSATEDHGPFGKRLRLWSVITNAGVGLLAPFEVTPMLEIENLFQVNVFGVVRTVKAFLPFLRRCNGRVIVTSSLAGSIPVPNLIAYSMSKMAVKAFAIGLQRELRPFRIRCITIEPFFYRTRLIVSPEQSLGVKVGAVDDTDQRTIYAAFIEEWEQQKKIIQNQADDMEAPMRAFGHALCSVRPKPCYYVMSSMLRMLIYLAPLFDVSYTDFVIAFNRNPAQTMDDIISLEDDRSSESRKIQLQGNRKVEKDKKTNKSSTKPSAHSKKGSPDCGEATPSADSSGNSPQPAAQKEANVSRRALKKDDEGSPGDKRPSQNATPDKKK